MRKRLCIAMIVALAAFGAAAAPLSRDDYKAERKRLDTEAQAERKKCGPFYGERLDLCVARVKGEARVARAELEAAYKPSPRAFYNAALARARATEAFEIEECQEKPRGLRPDCVREAKAVRLDSEAEALRTMR